MTYQRRSEMPKKGITEQEFRIRSKLIQNGFDFLVDQAYCYRCHSIFKTDGKNYPHSCRNCRMIFDSPDQWCMPDFVLKCNNQSGILMVNGGIHTKNKKHIEKDRRQIAELRKTMFVFVLDNEEVDNMHDSTLTAYLSWITSIIGAGSNWSYDQMYKNEKEYPCLL